MTESIQIHDIRICAHDVSRDKRSTYVVDNKQLSIKYIIIL